MMRLKPSLKSLVKFGLLFNLITFLATSLSGCKVQIEFTYKEKDIPEIIKNICKKDYDLSVITKRVDNTLWVYIPQEKILIEDIDFEKGKVFEESFTEKLNHLLTSIGRVIVNVDKSPDFFVLVASDITTIGLDYMIAGFSLDIKKSYAGYIPWPEAQRRYVYNLSVNPAALADKEGKHLKTFNITLPDFLAMQISQRVSSRFQDEKLKNYYKVNSVNGYFNYDIFELEFDIEELKKYKKPFDLQTEILQIIAYVTSAYEFKDFIMVRLSDLRQAKILTLSRLAMQERLKGLSNFH